MIAPDPSKSPLVVIDASVALAWTLPDTEDNHRYAAEVLELRGAGYRLVVPGSVFTTEVAYVLLKHGRREKEGEAMTAERAEFIEQFIDQEYHLRTRAPSMVRYAGEAQRPGVRRRLSRIGTAPGRATMPGAPRFLTTWL